MTVDTLTGDLYLLFMARRKAHIPAAVARAVYARDGRRCLYCGALAPLTLDHVLPEAKEGQPVAHNLVVACGPCNEEKHVTPLDLFAVMLERAGKGRASAILARVVNHLLRSRPR